MSADNLAAGIDENGLRFIRSWLLRLRETLLGRFATPGALSELAPALRSPLGWVSVREVEQITATHSGGSTMANLSAAN